MPNTETATATHRVEVATLDGYTVGEFCDVTIDPYDELGDVDRDAEDRFIFETDVRPTDGDRNERVVAAAEAILSANGWEVVGYWEWADYGPYADVRRA